MTPEEKARVKIDKQLINAGWDIVSRDEYVPRSASAVKEALMQGNTESDYLLFVDDKAIAVVEAKREENPLGEDVQVQAEDYACNPQNWYGLWFLNQIPLVYLANGKKIYFKRSSLLYGQGTLPNAWMGREDSSEAVQRPEVPFNGFWKGASS